MQNVKEPDMVGETGLAAVTVMEAEPVHPVAFDTVTV